MKFIGITGGVGAGKSTVLTLLKEMTNSIIVPADRLAESLLEAGSPVLERVAALEWPRSILREDGSMNRALVADFIYGDEGLREAMDDIVHPAVKEAVLDMRQQALQDGKVDYFFFEAALLIEAGYKELVDQVWYIYAGQEIRRDRLKESRGYSDERIDEIMGKQLSEAQFRKVADVIIDNSYDADNTRTQLKEILNEL